MLINLGHAFEQQEFADVDVLLLAPQPDAAADVAPAMEIRRLPSHVVILSASPYFKAQALRWQQQDDDASVDEPNSKRHKAAWGDVGSGSSSSQARPTVSLTLPHADQEPAAIAVLAAMYGAKTPAQLQQELSQKQQLQAAVIADMLQVPAISSALVKSLVVAAGDSWWHPVAGAGSSAGLGAEVVQAYLDLLAVPACLLPLLGPVMAAALKQRSQFSRAAIERCCLGVLGDLEAVWAAEQLREVLLGLPLGVMEVLLSCDDLKVASEDTVLYTAQAYVNKQQGATKQQAQRALAPLIRCPHLSQYWKGSMALSPAADELLLSIYIPQIRQLLALDIAGVDRESDLDIGELVSHAPPSWQLPPRKRALVPGGGVSMQWRVPVAELEAACRKCSERRKSVNLWSPACTPPLCGVAWKLMVKARWVEDAGVTIGVFTGPIEMPAGTFCRFEGDITSGQVTYHINSPLFKPGQIRGRPRFFGIGAMSGGWDAAAWSARGLPTSGELLVELKVTSFTGGEASNTDGSESK